mgnify:CR=1 FL=1
MDTLADPNFGIGTGATPAPSQGGASFGIGATTPKKTAAKKAAPKDNSPLGAALSFGQSFIDVISTPLYFVEGAIAGAQKGQNVLEAGAKNATAWTKEGQRPVTGSEILKNAGMSNDFWSSLAADILLDPLTYTPADLVSVPLKVIGVAGRTAAKAGKLAAAGEVSVKVATEAGQAGKLLKPGTDSFLNQYTKKQIIKENLLNSTSEALKAREAKTSKVIQDKFTYRTADVAGQVTAKQVVASSAEAMYKSAASTFLAEFAKHDMTKIAKSEMKAAKTAAKTIKNATNLVKDAEQTLSAPKISADGMVKDMSPYQPHVSADGVHVMDQSKGIHTFANEAEAKNWIKAQADAPKAAIKVTKGEAPIFDTNPFDNSTTAVGSLPTNAENAAQAAKRLDEVNKIVKSAKATSDVVTISDTVKKILDKPLASDLAGRIQPEIAAQISRLADGTQDPFSLITSWATKDAKSQETSVLKIVLDTKLTDKAGKTASILDVYNSGIPFNKLSAASQKTILGAFAKVNAGTANIAGDLASKMAELAAAVGPEVAKQIAAAKGGKALNEILAKLPQTTTAVEKKYANFADFIAGLRANDHVPFPVMEKVLKRLDPESDIIKSIEAGLDKATAYEQIKSVLVANGPQTVYETERRIALLDPEVMVKSTGLSNADVASAYYSGRLSQDLEITPEVFRAARDQASARVANYMARSKTSFMQVLQNINNGMGKNAEEMLALLEAPNPFNGISKFGDLTVRNTDKAYMSGSRAVLTKQLNQHLETKVLGSMFGIIRKDLTKKGVTPTPAALMAEFLSRSAMMDDALLAITGGRIVSTKAFKRGESKYFAYVTVGDFARIMSNKNPDLLMSALFPDLTRAGITKHDALSTIGISNAIRTVLERTEQGATISKEEIAGLLRSSGTNQAPRSATFMNRLPKIADDIADVLMDPATIKQFQEIHAVKASAVIEDALAPAETLTEDIYNALVEGHKANIAFNKDSTAARAQLVRDWFNKFVYSSGIFNQQSGEVAQAVFQASAMLFIQGGKLQKKVIDAEISRALVGSPTARDEMDRRIFGDIVEAINSFFKMQRSSAYAGAGRERLPFPTPASMEKANNKLVEAMQNIEDHRAARGALTTKRDLSTWTNRMEKLQVKLDDARLLAWENNIPTFHYMPDGSKVLSTQYSEAAAKRMAQDLGIDRQVTQEGVQDVTAALLDSKVAFPSHKALTAAESKKWLANWRKENNVAAMVAAEGAAQEAAQDTLKHLDEYDQLGLSLDEKYQRMFQAPVAKVYDDAQFKVITGATNYVKGLTKQLPEKLSATAGRYITKPFLNRAESTLMQSISNVADYADKLRSTYINVWAPDVRAANFTRAFQYATSAAGHVPAHEEQIMKNLVADLKNMLDPIFGNPQTSGIISSGLDPYALQNAFRKYDLGDTIGFGSVGNLNPAQLADFSQWLPFAEMPEALKGTPEAAEWASRMELFQKSGKDPFVVLTNVIQAVQFAKTEKTFVMDFATNFSYKARGLTFEQAMKEGWVKIEGVGAGGTNLATYLPSPEAGGLFPPHIAEEFLSLNREWNKLYNSGGMPTFIKTAMDVVGFFKATQTILRPGHHITNAVGDTTTAIIAGTRNPIHWKQGLELSLMFAGEDARAAWGKNSLNGKFVQMFQGFKGYGRAFEGTTKEGATVPAIALYNKSGKAMKHNLSNEELLRAFQERGIIVGNIFQNDIQGLTDSVIMDAAQTGAKKKLNEVVSAGLHKATSTIEKPFGSFASYYGNIPRAAHAMQVIQSRAWNSIDDALNAASLEVTRYHPTIQSLSATERRYPRLAFTYYTWLRVAHNALIDMALRHTAAMAIPSKIQYQQANQAGLNPTSMGNAWGNKTDTPNYMNYSTYAPTETGPNGRIMYKHSILPMDVLDTWNFTFDPNMTLDQNAFTAIKSGMRTLGKSTNLVAQPIIEGLTGTDMSTGNPSSVKDIQTLGDKLVGNIGTVGLLKGLGIYTPAKNAPGGSNPTTPLTQSVQLENFFTGQKKTLVDTAASKKNAAKEQSAHSKLVMENYLKNQGK